MRNKGLWFMGAAVLLATALTAPLAAQQAGGGGGGGRGAGGREAFYNMIKDNLGAKDDEWKALQPKVEKVLTAQRDARSGGMFGMFGRGRGGGGGAGGAGGDNQPLSPVAEKAKDLKTVLDDKEAKPEDIKAKLTALREAKVKAAEELKKARQELTELLTVRQEAVLVEMNILE